MVPLGGTGAWSGSCSHVAAGRSLDRRMARTAELFGRRHLGAGPRRDPAGPVLPPGAGMQLGVVLPLLRIGGAGLVGPVFGFRSWRVDDPRDVSRAAQHEPAISAEQLSGLVA